MVFSSTVFMFLFLPIVLIVYYNPLIKDIRFKNIWLFIASMIFYAWGEPIFVFLMIFSIIVTWIFGLLMDRDSSNSKILLVLSIIYHIIVIFIFKYLAFLVKEVGLLLFHQDIAIGIELPIGISFFTFQMMSYLFDVYYKKVAVQKNIIKLALYVSLFPQLIAGPIVRYNQIAEQIDNRQPGYDDIVAGMKRFIYGIAKKVLIANYMAQVADNVFDYIDNRTVAMAWLGAICYTLQIYFDFSGYSDMAIGLGRMFGFRFSENFNYPYISRSVTEFWRRWHISLSSWFRDYVYIPLGGNRHGKTRQIINLFIVWLLTGIWHGANWTFLIWGLLYFIILVVEKICKVSGDSNYNSKFPILRWLYTIIIVVFTWVIFRSESVAEAIVYLGEMLGICSTGLADSAFTEYITATIIVLTLAIIGSTPLIKKVIDKVLASKFYWLESLWVVLIFIVTLLQVISVTYNPFIYFNF